MISARPQTRIRVVIADDDPSIREILIDFVTAQPSLELVGVATTGDEAVEICREQEPDVALMDVRMPGTGGVGAVRRLRQMGSRTRVVALSAYADRGAVTEMLQAGAAGYLVKGSSVDQILEALHRAAQGQSSLSPAVAPLVFEELQARLGREHRAQEAQRQRIARVRAVVEHRRFSMVFQPIVELATGRAVGFEALARFADEPIRPPDQWFADAEMVGLSVDLEIAAIALALADLERLPEDAYLAVNVSPVTAISERLIPVLLSVAPERTVLEVTEHAPVADYERLIGALKPLRKHGIRLAIDDAGAGFASLRHILRLEPDLIKLDISLTQHIDTDRSRRALARGLISFGAEVGSRLVGEGVETATELAALQNLGVPYAQGYYLGRPEPLPTR